MRSKKGLYHTQLRTRVSARTRASTDRCERGPDRLHELRTDLAPEVEPCSLRLFLLLQRKIDDETTTYTRLVRHADRPAVCVDGLLDDRQSQSEPGPIEAFLDVRLEQLSRQFVGHPAAVIRDFEASSSVDL